MPDKLITSWLFPHTTGNTSFAKYRTKEQYKPEITYTYQTTNQGIPNLKSLLLKQDKQLYKVDTYDDGSLTQQFIDKNGNLQTLTLPQIDVYSEYIPNNQKYKDSYRLLTYNLRQKGFNNWANRLDDIAKSEGVGNALHLHNNMVSRVNELRKAKGSNWDDSDIAILLDAAGIPMKLAEILTLFDGGYGEGLNVKAPKFIRVPSNKAVNTLDNITNKIKPIRDYKIARVINSNLDNTVPVLSEMPYSKQLYMNYPSSNILEGMPKEYYDFAIKPYSNNSKLSKSEQLGIPKHIRKMDSPKIWNLIEPYKYYKESPWRKKELVSNFKKWYSNNNMLQDRNKILPRWYPFGNDLPTEMLQFAKDLPESTIKYSDNHINAYRNYLTDIYYNHERLSDLDIQKILNASEKAIVEKQTGLFKGKRVYHAADKIFDQFEWRNTGEHTLNMGGQGPANYFSSNGSIYGNKIQPYFINDVHKAVPGFAKDLYFQYKPTPSNLSTISYKDRKLITPGHYLYDAYQLRKNEIQQAIYATKESNTIYYGNDIPLQYFNGTSLEFALPRNTGIISLFPHPKTFRQNSDGTISLIRDWDDPRVNYKSGGKLISRKNELLKKHMK